MSEPATGDAESHLDPTAGLPVIESCEGCGACCFEQGAPPDYVALRMNPEFAADPSFAEDAARLAVIPDAAARLLEQYLEQSARNEIPTNGICVWYDKASGSCRFYELRPSTCRVFELSSIGCRIYRKRNGLGRLGELPAPQ